MKMQEFGFLGFMSRICHIAVEKMNKECYNGKKNKISMEDDAMLSKSKYCSFVQCSKNLWLGVNKPELATEDTSLESKLDKGNMVGDLAMRLFGDYVEVTAYKPDGKLDLSKMIRDTKALMDRESPVICEASFSYNGDYCAVDILKREGDGYAIYEVKSSTEVKDIYITDVAYQKYVLQHLDVNVTGTYIVCINNSYVFDGELKLDELFRIVPVGDRVNEEIASVEENIREANRVLSENCEPDVDLSMGCHKPYPCVFWQYCSAGLPSPSVFDLFGSELHFDKKLKLYNDGICSFEALSQDNKIMKKNICSLQIKHEIQDLEPHVNREGIKEFLDTLWYPLYFLDFETMQSIIPEFVGTKPYAQIPFQYSLHYIENEGGELQHKEFLAESGENPLRGIAERLCEDIPEDACVIVFNQRFERGRLEELASYFPDLSKRLKMIKENIRDLMIPFSKGYYYNRKMEGSYSIKKVLPAMFPDNPSLNYHNLEGVHNGGEAMELFPKIKDLPEEEQIIARKNLLKYCELDTYATVKIWQELVRISK